MEISSEAGPNRIGTQTFSYRNPSGVKTICGPAKEAAASVADRFGAATEGYNKALNLYVGVFSGTDAGA